MLDLMFKSEIILPEQVLATNPYHLRNDFCTPFRYWVSQLPASMFPFGFHFLLGAKRTANLQRALALIRKEILEIWHDMAIWHNFAI